MKRTFLNLMKRKSIAIGMVHLLPLPGSPEALSLNAVIKRAVSDAKNLQKAGFDAIIIENFGDSPFYSNRVPPETISSFTYVANKVSEMVTIPFGINVLRNDGFAAVAIANTVGANFIRVNVFISAALTDQGIIQGEAAQLVRYRNNLNEDISILADVSVKHSYPLTGTKPELVQEIKEAYFRGKADAIILSGTETGAPPEVDDILRIKSEIKNIPLVLGSGAGKSNIQQFKKVFNAIIIGTSIKKGKVTTNPVDLSKAKEMIKSFKK